MDIWSPELTDDEVRALELLRRDRVKLLRELQGQRCSCCFGFNDDDDSEDDSDEEETPSSKTSPSVVVMSPVNNDSGSSKNDSE